MATQTLTPQKESTNGTTKRRELKVALPEFTTCKIRIEGTSPLITDAFSQEAKDRLAKSQDGSPKEKPGPRDPQREFENSSYRPGDGMYAIPKLAFLKSFKEAAARMTEHKGTELLAAVAIDTPDEYLKLEADEPTMRTDHVVRMGRGNLVYRSEFFPWSAVVPIKLDEDVITLDQLVHIVAKAGMGIGIGNWRPEKKGDKGTWKITEIFDAEIHGGE